MFLVRAIRNKNRFVRGLVLYQLSFARCHYANHFIRHSVHEDRLTQRIFVWIQCLGYIRTDERDVSAVQILALANVSSTLCFGIEHDLIRRQYPVVVHSSNFLIFVARAHQRAPSGRILHNPRHYRSRNRSDVWAKLSYGLGILKGKWLARAFFRSGRPEVWMLIKLKMKSVSSRSHSESVYVVVHAHQAATTDSNR
jgi:hypothetical protein